MPWVRDLELNVNEKMVLYTLTLRADNRSAQTFMSVGTIAREGGFSPNSKNTVRRALVSLREKGLVSWRGQVRKGTAEQTANLYTVHWEVGAESTHLDADNTNVGAESTTKKRSTNKGLNKSIYSPSPEGDANDAPPTSQLEARENSIGAKADPVSPEWFASPARSEALTLIQTIGRRKRDKQHDAYHDGLADLAEHLNHHLRSAGEAFDVVLDYWNVPAACATDRNKAATKLNQLISTVKRDFEDVTYRSSEVTNHGR